jgi:nitrous oxide reductase
MSAQHSLMARRHFLITSALVGTAGLIVPAAAHAAIAPPPPGDTQTIAPAPSTSASEGGVASAMLVATAATAETSGDT